MPRLLVFCEYPTMLGGERSLLAVLAGVRAAGFDLAVACPAEGPLAEELREDEVPILPAQWRDEQGGRRPLDEFRDELLRIIRLYQPELVHANGLSIGRVAGPVVDELRLPSVAHLRDILKLRRAEIADLNRHRRLVAVSHATRDYHIVKGSPPSDPSLSTMASTWPTSVPLGRRLDASRARSRAERAVGRRDWTDRLAERARYTARGGATDR